MNAASEGYIIEAGAPPRGRLRGLLRRRALLRSFAVRELQVRYRQAVFGVGWALFQPAALTVVTTLVFHRFLSVPTTDAPYPLFVYTGLLAWTFFHTALVGAVPTLVNNAGLVRKIWFPRETLPLGTVAAVGLDLAVGLLLWVVLLLAYAAPITIALLWVPVLLAILVAFTAACALLGAAVNVRFRDVKHGLPLALQLLFFATPIVYPLALVPAGWRTALAANPLTAVVCGLREAALQGTAPDPARTLTGAAVVLALLVGSWQVFIRADRRFADIV
jgi:lipopolysaccharide transport system permease protein